MEIIPKLKAEIIKHIREELPKESCGLFIIFKGKRIYYKCKNISTDNNTFIMCPEDFANAEDMGTIEYIIHSHINLPCIPSETDKAMCSRSGLPWIIFSYPKVDYDIIYPDNYEVPLLGRPFVHGALDCYALSKDYYLVEHNIILPEFYREDDWWHKGKNIYIDNFKEAGFIEIDLECIQAGDALLLKISSPVLNHSAIYLGENKILQHFHGRLSSIDVYGGYYKRSTEKAFRHKNLC